MNALSVYLTTCRYVMQADVSDKDTWVELYRYLPYLRQALACCVCRNLLKEPMGPTDSVCHHFVCRKCIGGKMKLKPQCSWCKDQNEFKENTQLRLTVLCFKQLCQYISDTEISRELRANSPNGETNNLIVIIDEAQKFEDSFTITPLQLPASFSGLLTVTPNKHSMKKCKYRAKKCEENVPSTSNVITSDDTEVMNSPTKSESSTQKEDLASSNKDLQTSLNIDNESLVDSEAEIIIDVDDSEKPTLAETNEKQMGVQENDKSTCRFILSPEKQKSLTVLSPQSTGSKELKGDNSHINKETPLKKPKVAVSEHKEVKICKCGRGGTNSRLTCLGQRCPCYIKRLPCIGCKCKGCRNPRKAVNVDQDLKIAKSDNSSNISLSNSENIFVTV